MGSIVLFVILLLTAVGCRFGSRYFRQEQEKQVPDQYTKKINKSSGQWAVALRIITWASVALAFLSIIASSVSQVDNGHVGLVYTFGKITGQRNAGVIITWPWQNVVAANVQTQKEIPDSSCSDDAHTPNCLDAASSETQDVFITPVINVRVDEHNIQTLYIDTGPDYINKLVQPRVAQITKEETAKYKAKDIIPSRAILRDTISKRLTAELASDSIVVEDFLITDIHFSNAYNQAIENNVIAEQNALTEQSNVAIHQAQAQQQVADAQGVADSNVVLAQGQADANALISASLTSELLEYTAIQKLNPNVSVMLVPAGNGLILDIGNLIPAGAQNDTGS